VEVKRILMVLRLECWWVVLNRRKYYSWKCILTTVKKREYEAGIETRIDGRNNNGREYVTRKHSKKVEEPLFGRSLGTEAQTTIWLSTGRMPADVRSCHWL